MGEYEPDDSRIVTQKPSNTPGADRKGGSRPVSGTGSGCRQPGGVSPAHPHKPTGRQGDADGSGMRTDRAGHVLLSMMRPGWANSSPSCSPFPMAAMTTRSTACPSSSDGPGVARRARESAYSAGKSSCRKSLNTSGSESSNPARLVGCLQREWLDHLNSRE